eukprot:CAMPEP_0116867172 /NCGR_PEP_ID=MMETSP0418-20121206/26466_1 /TAXON_ID=1158023 /ORGANISM="Astrosyne radiata, Strain 13vi08-1A" /LENGTH=43 /DNA_ID= /DNA_START= /DNA_END= /DNA_ORIENTATION=
MTSRPTGATSARISYSSSVCTLPSSDDPSPSVEDSSTETKPTP